MAIERALRLKGQDLNFQAAKAGAEFSQLLNEGNREAAEAKLGEARELFNQAGEIDLLQAEVLNRLSAFGGDIPLERFNELLGVTENAPVMESTVISTHPEPSTEHSPVLTEVEDLQKTLQPTIQREGSEQAEKSPVIHEGASSKPEEQKRIFLSPRQETVAYALFATNQDRTDFEYSTLSEVAKYAYADLLEGTPSDKRKDREHSIAARASGVRQKLVEKLHEAESTPDEVSPNMANFINWLREQPEYASLSMTELASVAQRKISFEELSEKTGEPRGSQNSRVIKVSTRGGDAETEEVKSQEYEKELPRFRINKEDRVISIEQNGEQRTIPFHKKDKNTLFDLLNFFANQPREAITTQTIDEFLKANGVKMQVGMQILHLRAKIGDEQKTIIETIGGARRDAKYRFNVVVEPWEDIFPKENDSFGAETDGVNNAPPQESHVQLEPFEERRAIEERRIKGDLGMREEKVAHALLAINEARTDFAFTSTKDAVHAAFGDLLENITDEETRAKREIVYQASFREARERAFERLVQSDANPDKALPHLSQFKKWIKSNPEYANLSMNDLYIVLRRSISFDELLQKQNVTHTQEQIVTIPVVDEASLKKAQDVFVESVVTDEVTQIPSFIETETPTNDELTPVETYLLAQLLSSENRNVLSKYGITVGLEDRPQIREIAEKYASQVENLDEGAQSKQREVLLNKLIGYVGNKEEVFMANLANENALFLLAFMAGVTSEDTMKELLGYTSDVKKNG